MKEQLEAIHACTQQFDIAFALAHPAALSVALEAHNVNLCAGFCEREVVGTQTDLAVIAVLWNC